MNSDSNWIRMNLIGFRMDNFGFKSNSDKFNRISNNSDWKNSFDSNSKFKFDPIQSQLN